MNKLLLEIAFQISGISAASGLYYTNNELYLISDNSNVLYQYSIENNRLLKNSLFENIQEGSAKKDKLDFEAITFDGEHYLIFGSGSKPNREVGLVFEPKFKQTEYLQLDILYQSIANYAGIEIDEFNIEGALFFNNDLYLFNRGNGKNNRNFIAIIQGKNIVDEFNIILKDIKLPKLNGVDTGFSDAVLVDDKIYFLATAEGVKSTYNDGKIAGTIIGNIDAKKLKLKNTKVLDYNKKLEGLTVLKNDKKQITFLLCEDNDTESENAIIYKLNIKK